MLLFHTKIRVPKHASKKNNKSAFFSRKTGKAWVTRSKSAIEAENYLINILKSEKNKKRLETITDDIHVRFTFYFKDYFTNKMQRAKTILDQSNCYLLPEDALQKSGIISNDSNICSHDGSRRRPGTENILEIEIFKYIE